MQETIACPECKRRLVLPAGESDNVVQCPSCGARFVPGAAGADRRDPSHSKHRLPATGPEFQPPADSRSEETDRTRDFARLVRKKPTRRRGSWGILCAWLAGIVLLVGVGSLFVFVAWPVVSPGQATITEDEEQRRAEVRAAFAARNPANPVEVEELKQLFLSLGQALRAADGERITSFYDLERMAEEFNGLLGANQRSSRTRREFARSLRQVWAKTMAQQAPLLAWDDFEIRSVKKLGEDEAVVILRHEDGKGTASKMRWWVVRRDGAWKVYDMEDLDSGIRTSTTVALLMAGGAGKIDDSRRGIEAIRDACQALTVQGDVDAAERKLKEAEGIQLPKPLAALRWMLEGSIRLRRGKPDEALDAFSQASALHPDMPILDLLRGMAYNQLGQWAKGLKHLEAYRDLLGEDAIVCHQLGDVLRGLERFAEAAFAYRKSLDKNPRDAEVFQGFLQALGNDEAKDVAPRFAKLDTPREHFETLAEDCEQRKVYDILESLTQAMRKIDPAFTPVDYYLSLGKARAGQAEEAVALFRTALAGQRDAAKKQTYLDGFFTAMASGRKHAEAYAVAPVPRDAFRFLATEAMKSHHRDELKRLVEAHEKKDAADPLLPLYQGQVFADQGLYTAADKAFSRALTLAPEKDSLEPFRASRVLARYHTGNGLSAYREIGPRQETFLQLVTLAFYANDEDRLRELLDVHAKKEPDSLDLLRFRTRLKVRQKKIPEGLALFAKMLARRLPEDKRSQLISEFLSDMGSAGLPVEGYRAAPDAEKAFREVAEELTDDDRYDELRKLIEAHRERRPADAWLVFYLGEVHLHLGAWDVAERLLRDGLKKAPEEVRERLRPRLIYAAYKGGRSLQVYAELEWRDKTFAQLANLMSNDKKGADLEALIAAHAPHAGPAERLTLLTAEMMAKVFSNKPAEAAALLHKSLKEQPDEAAKRGYVYRFSRGMQAMGQSVEGYRAVPDKRAAFDTLASSLLRDKKDRDLAVLLDEHGKKHVDDPLLPFFLGELHLLRGNPGQAEPHLAAAFARKTSAVQWRLRNGLFRARVKLGRSLATYQEIEPKAETFVDLAHLCLDAKDVRQLQALIDAHRKTHPKDVNLPIWDLELLWSNHDYDGVLKHIAQHREGPFALPGTRSKVEAYQIRSLVRSKRTADALREATRPVVGQPLLLILAHASSGDVGKTLAVLEKLRLAPFLLRSCYEDDDLGPILRSAPFEELRQKFPKPKDRN